MFKQILAALALVLISISAPAQVFGTHGAVRLPNGGVYYPTATPHNPSLLYPRAVVLAPAPAAPVAPVVVIDNSNCNQTNISIAGKGAAISFGRKDCPTNQGNSQGQASQCKPGKTWKRLDWPGHPQNGQMVCIPNENG